jgi:hypothetical protein
MDPIPTLKDIDKLVDLLLKIEEKKPSPELIRIFFDLVI